VCQVHQLVRPADKRGQMARQIAWAMGASLANAIIQRFDLGRRLDSQFLNQSPTVALVDFHRLCQVTIPRQENHQLLIALLAPGSQAQQLPGNAECQVKAQSGDMATEQFVQHAGRFSEPGLLLHDQPRLEDGTIVENHPFHELAPT